MPFGWGEVPAGYNPKVHGPYDPSVFYGKSKFFLKNQVKTCHIYLFL